MLRCETHKRPAVLASVLRGLAAGLAIVAVCGCTSADSAVNPPAFISPFVSPEAPADMAASCPPIPQPPQALRVGTPYREGDSSFSEIDAGRQQAQRAALAPLNTYTSLVARYANRYMESRGGDRLAGTCAIKWLNEWADQGAMVQVPDHMGQYSRSVALASWAISYAQVRSLEMPGTSPHPRIRAWMNRLAHDTVSHYDGLTNMTARNNHRYWAGLAALTVGTETNDGALTEWGLASARIGLDQVQPDGALPLEIARRSQARTYQLYASGPLVMMAEYAARNGTDLYGYRDGAMHRLVAFSLHSIDDPAAIEKLAGARQSPFVDPRGAYYTQGIAFFEFYQKRFPGRVPEASELLSHRPLVNAELGGDLTMLAQAATPD